MKRDVILAVLLLLGIIGLILYTVLATTGVLHVSIWVIATGGIVAFGAMALAFCWAMLASLWERARGQWAGSWVFAGALLGAVACASWAVYMEEGAAEAVVIAAPAALFGFISGAMVASLLRMLVGVLLTVRQRPGTSPRYDGPFLQPRPPELPCDQHERVRSYNHFEERWYETCRKCNALGRYDCGPPAVPECSEHTWVQVWASSTGDEWTDRCQKCGAHRHRSTRED